MQDLLRFYASMRDSRLYYYTAPKITNEPLKYTISFEGTVNLDDFQRKYKEVRVMSNSESQYIGTVLIPSYKSNRGRVCTWDIYDGK
jgi:hypothetical protein